MSRKRFVKLLMSRGIQRNTAQIEAQIVAKFATLHDATSNELQTVGHDHNFPDEITDL